MKSALNEIEVVDRSSIERIEESYYYESNRFPHSLLSPEAYSV